MIRPLNLVDTARITVLRGFDWAVTPTGPASGNPSSFSPGAFLWDRFQPRHGSAAWISTKGAKTVGLVSARPCSGPTAWMVKHLVTPLREEEPCCELLGRVAVHAGRRGAERLFLHLPDDWHLVEMVGQSGFVPCTQVFLFTLAGRSPLLGVEPAKGFQPRTSNDDFSLFRLRNATTPADVQCGIGTTFQQWEDAQDTQRKGTRELVLEQDGESKVWIRLDYYRKWTKIRLVVHPAWEGDLQSLVALALAQKPSRIIMFEVPEYQIVLRALLERVGFEITGSYRLVVKSLAIRVKEPSLAPLPTASYG
ncbi:MAG: hypothetical protein V3S37_01045 [Dehalococcoidia bacterium]